MRLGPIAYVVVVVPNLEVALRAYQVGLQQRLHTLEPVSEEDALRLGASAMIGAASAWLCCATSDTPWLRVIEDPEQAPAVPFQRRGWLAIEILVANVDALRQRLGAEFRVLREPADLDLGDAIRACQVQGPGGEVWYLTQVKRAVPPFSLPQSDTLPENGVGPAFVMVLAVQDLVRSSGFYGGLGGLQDWSFETRLGALNQAHGFAVERKHRVCVWQLRAQHLLELDQAPPELLPVTRVDGRLSTGIAHVALARSDEQGRRLDQHYRETSPQYLSGPDGESLSLL